MTRAVAELFSYISLAIIVGCMLLTAFHRFRAGSSWWQMREMIKRRERLMAAEANAYLVEVEARADAAQEFWRALRLARAREQFRERQASSDLWQIERENSGYRYKGLGR